MMMMLRWWFHVCMFHVYIAVGRVWINVADYVDKGQITYARLDKEKG